MTCAATRGVTDALGQIPFLFEKPGLGLEETREVLKYNWANNGSALNKKTSWKTSTFVGLTLISAISRNFEAVLR